MTGLVFDPSRLEELLDLGAAEDRQFVIELVEVFLDSARTRLQELDTARAVGDCRRVEAAAHALKGSAGNLGACALQDVAQALMIASRRGDRAGIDALSAELLGALVRAEAALREFTQSLDR